MSNKGCTVTSCVAISEDMSERNHEEGKEETGPVGRREGK
jgi:hypothetical protein